MLRSSTVSFPEERSVTFTIFFSVPTAKFRDSILKYATDASFQILSNSHFIIVILFYSERYVTNAVDIASLKCWGEKERERERWSIPSMLCDRHAQQRLHSSAACVQLPQWPHPLPGTSKPSFKVSYNNSIHSIPLRNTIPPPFRSLHRRPLPALPSSATLSISPNDSTLFFSFSSLLHFFLTPYRHFVYIWKASGWETTGQKSRTMADSCWSN